MNVRQMQAAVITAPKQVRIENVGVPGPGEGEVRVRLRGCGVCGSNLAPWEGRPWFKYPFAPGEPGHEGWGVVDALGEGVSEILPGTRVAFLGSKSFAEYEIVPETSVVPLPEALDAKPFPGEALGCAFNVMKRCEIQAGQNVAVIGIGFLGAIITALAAQAGANLIAITRR